MMTLSEMTMKTNWMMEMMRQNAIVNTIEKFKAACHSYYKNGYDNGETVQLVKELEKLGLDIDEIADIESEIRELY